MSTTFKMKLNIPQTQQTQQTQRQTQVQTQVQTQLSKHQATNLVLRSTTKRTCVPLHVTGNKKCSSCGHR